MQSVCQKIKEISGDELDIDVGEFFNGREQIQVNATEREEEKSEVVIDSVQSIDIKQEDIESRRLKIRDIGGTSSADAHKVSGIIDDQGNQIGHRHPSGNKRRAKATGRKGVSTGDGPDKIYDGMREVYVDARIISKGNGFNKMIFTAEDDIAVGELEVVTLGENGRSLQIKVESVVGVTTYAEVVDGHIRIKNVKAREKNTLEFRIIGNKKYAMGVRAYGN